jgi:hypothetical protein
MGRNSAIKRYNATLPGQPLELFETKRSRLPVIVELLASPWIVRASELVRGDGACATKHTDEPVTVEWNAERGVPVWFAREQRRYRIDAVLQVWAVERSWWDPRRRVARRFFRVLARGGVYDLAFDRETGAWRLVGIQD